MSTETNEDDTLRAFVTHKTLELVDDIDDLIDDASSIDFDTFLNSITESMVDDYGELDDKLDYFIYEIDRESVMRQLWRENDYESTMPDLSPPDDDE